LRETDRDLLVEAARIAGEIGRKYFRSDPEVWDKDGGQGPVTEADLEIDRALKQYLMEARPSYGWLSEETDDTPDQRDADTVFIVDPIDGTRAFVDGRENWSHSLAIASRGEVTAAAVYVPIKDMMFAAEAGQGATLNGSSLSVSAGAEGQARVLASKPNFDRRFWPGGPPDVTQDFRSSLAYRMALVADGSFDGMLTLRATWEWDVAAGSLLVAEAGGRVSQMDGRAPRFNNAHPALNGLVAAGPTLHSQLMGRLLDQSA